MLTTILALIHASLDRTTQLSMILLLVVWTAPVELRRLGVNSRPGIIWWRIVFERLNNSINVRLHLFHLFGKVAKSTVFGDSVVVDRRHNPDSGLLIRKARAQGNPDLEHPSIQVGHWLAKIRDLPQERVTAHELQVEGKGSILVRFHNLLILTLKIGGNTDFSPLCIQTFFGPSRSLLVNGVVNEIESSLQITVLIGPIHSIAAMLKLHLLEFLSISVLFGIRLDGAQIGIVVPQKAPFEQIFEGLEFDLVHITHFLQRLFDVIVDVRLPGGCGWLDLTIREDTKLFFKLLYDGDAQSLVPDLTTVQPPTF
jgi:hypothetical protein